MFCRQVPHEGFGAPCRLYGSGVGINRLAVSLGGLFAKTAINQRWISRSPLAHYSLLKRFNSKQNETQKHLFPSHHHIIFCGEIYHRPMPALHILKKFSASDELSTSQQTGGRRKDLFIWHVALAAQMPLFRFHFVIISDVAGEVIYIHQTEKTGPPFRSKTSML